MMTKPKTFAKLKQITNNNNDIGNPLRIVGKDETANGASK